MSKEDEERAKRNKDLIRRMKAGEDLILVDTSESWFPQRHVFKRSESILAKREKREREEQEKDISS